MNAFGAQPDRNREEFNPATALLSALVMPAVNAVANRIVDLGIADLGLDSLVVGPQAKGVAQNFEHARDFDYKHARDFDTLSFNFIAAVTRGQSPTPSDSYQIAA